MKRWFADTYAVERRFSIGVLLILTVYCSLLLAFLRAIDFGFPIDFFFISGLTISAAVGQVFIKKLSPQLTSALIGAFYSIAWLLVGTPFLRHIMIQTAELTVYLIAIGIFGLLIGYCAGAVAASAFLLSDFINTQWTTEAGNADEDHLSPWD